MFEDEDLIVADKPAGLVTYDVKKKEPSVAAFFKDKISPELVLQFEDRGGLVHRLDKETSGLILIAKNPSALAGLQSQFKERQIQKEYTAIVHGELSGKGIIDLPVGRMGIGKMTTSAAKTKEAVTQYEVIKNLNGLTLVKLVPKTGRTHQLRVHMKAIGHPIVGDPLYGKVKQDKTAAVPRMLLHASKIVFTHPATKKELTFISTMPSEFEQISL